MTKEVFNNIKEASDYIQSIFPFRGSNAHFFNSHISNRGKEAYEFNIKCCISSAPWVEENWNAYNTKMKDELVDYVYFLKDEFSWIEECFTAGRSGGWLVITTYERVFEDWEDSDFIMNNEEVIKRANDLYFIENDIKEKIKKLESMSEEEAEEYWEYYKPEDWDKQVILKKEREERVKKERLEREKEVTNYIPGDAFYNLETTHRRYILNDRGDIISTFDKMKRNDCWHSFGRIPNGNPLVGWNQIRYFTQYDIAPKTISLKEAFNGKNIRGLSLVVYNAPTGKSEYCGETVEGIYTINKCRLADYGIKKVA